MRLMKKIGCLFLALCLLAAALPLSAAAHWADDAVSALNGIYGGALFTAGDTPMTEGDAYTVLNGMGCSTEGVTSGSATPLTRAKACAVLAKIFRLPVTDTGENAAIQYLYEQKIVNGRSANDLAEDDSVSQAEFAVLAYRILNATGGGKGSSVEALKPGSETYFAWMYLTARVCVPKEVEGTMLSTPIKDAHINVIVPQGDGSWSNGNVENRTGEGIWDAWYARLAALCSVSFTKPAYDENETMSAAAIRMVKAVTDADGSPYIFSDVTLDGQYTWAYDGLMYLFDRGIVSGTGEGKFEPAGDIIRAQFAALLGRMLTHEPTTAEKEVTLELPAAFSWLNNDATKAIISRGYVTPPTEDAAAWWSGNMTREETVAGMVKLCMGEYGVTNNLDAVNTEILSHFTDEDQISADAEPYLAYAVILGILRGTGDGRLAPAATTSRAEIAVLLYRIQVGLDTSKIKDYGDSVGYAKEED